MDNLTNSEDAERFLRGLGLSVDGNVVRQVVKVLSGETGSSLYALYATGRDKPHAFCGKGTVYKVKRLFDDGKLDPLLRYWRQRRLEGDAISKTLPQQRSPSELSESLMEMPDGLDRCLLILVLRTVGCSHDAVASIVHCHKLRVEEVERWFRELTREEAARLCDDQTIKRIVGRELVNLEEVDHEVLVKAGQVTGDDTLRRFRDDYLQWAREKVPPPHELVELLQQWRDQASFLSLDELLRVFGREVQQIESLRHITDRQRALEIYDAARGQHVQDIPEFQSVLPEVTEESLWQRLRQQYREDPVWGAQDSWGLAHGAYLKAFRLFFAEAQFQFECYFAGASIKMLEQRGLKAGVDTVVDVLDNLRKEDVDLAITLRLSGVIVSCDLLALGITQLPDSRLWLEVDKLETVRAEVVNGITELPEPSPVALDHIGTAAKLLWENKPEIRQKTGDLLDKLQSLQAADNDLHSKLSALERNLYGIDESKPL